MELHEVDQLIKIEIADVIIPHKVKMLNPNVFIGMDVLKRRPVITDKNPHVEGLQDVHKCIYLPSSMDKNQYLPNYLNQNILFMVTPPHPSVGINSLFYQIIPGTPQCPTLHTWYSSRAVFCHPKTSWLQHFCSS